MPFALQASDRLLTDLVNVGPLDPKANKSVVFATFGATVLFGYSGRAVVDYDLPTERTTDQWIAEQLAGTSLGVGAVMMGTPVYKWDLGLALRVLKRALEGDPLFARQHTEVSFCGTQWRRGHPERGVFSTWGTIEPVGASRYEIKHVRPREARPAYALTAIGDYAALDFQGVSDQLGTAANPEEAESILLHGIKDAADSSKRVGRDCLLVRLANGQIRVRYEGARPTWGEGLFPGASPVTVAATPTPWIVTPGMVNAPLTVAGGGMSIGNLQVEVEVPPGEGISETVGPGETPGSVVRRFILPAFGPYSSRYGPQPPPIPPPPQDPKPPSQRGSPEGPSRMPPPRPPKRRRRGKRRKR